MHVNSTTYRRLEAFPCSPPLIVLTTHLLLVFVWCRSPWHILHQMHNFLCRFNRCIDKIGIGSFAFSVKYAFDGNSSFQFSIGMKTLLSGSRCQIRSFFSNRQNVDHKIIEPCAWLMAETWLPVNDSRESAHFLIPTARAKSRRVFFRLIRRKALALIPTAREISTCTFPINSLKNAFSPVTVYNGSTYKQSFRWLAAAW